MPFKFSSIKILSILLVGMSFTSNFETVLFWPDVLEKSNHSTDDKISVRESNFDLQISVGDKIFVFGKSKGTLDKIKVGMHVLNFSQAAESDPSTFSKVIWKRQKDGSILIQSSYSPWPNILSWIVFSDGRLKMEASAPPADFVDSKWLGLGFNFPDQLLHLISWNSIGADFGQWQNMNYQPLADQEIKIRTENQGFFQPIRSVRMEFEEVILDVSTETSGVFLGFGENQNLAKSYPIMNTDMVFLFNQPIQDSEISIQSPSGDPFSGEILSQDPLVLWFHFQ